MSSITLISSSPLSYPPDKIRENPSFRHPAMIASKNPDTVADEESAMASSKKCFPLVETHEKSSAGKKGAASASQAG